MCTMCAIMIVNDSTWCAHRANSALHKEVKTTSSVIRKCLCISALGDVPGAGIEPARL